MTDGTTRSGRVAGLFLPLQGASVSELLDVLPPWALFGAILVVAMVLYGVVGFFARDVFHPMCLITLGAVFVAVTVGTSVLRNLFGLPAVYGLYVGLAYGLLAKAPEISIADPPDDTVLVLKIGVFFLALVMVTVFASGLPQCQDGGGLCLRTLLITPLVALGTQTFVEGALIFLCWRAVA